MKGLLERNRRRIRQELPGAEQLKFFTPSAYTQKLLTAKAISAYVHGKLIDIGCGNMPFKDLILSRVAQYDTFDIEKRVENVKFVGDIQNMNMISDNTYDCALCLDVLEHIQNPFKAMAEIERILKADGTLVLVVPHLSRLHEEPNDFFRFTKYGIRFLLEGAGFKVLEIKPAGGLFCFLGHQFSTVFVCLFWHIPVLRQIAFEINKWLCVKPCYWLDRFIDKKKIFAMAYLCVARKI